MIDFVNKTIFHYENEGDYSNLKYTTSESLAHDFYATLNWIDPESKIKTAFHDRQFVSYISFLIDLVNALKNFLIDRGKNEIKREKHYLTKLFFDDENLYQVWLINNIEQDGHIYMSYHWGDAPETSNGIVGSNPESPDKGHKNLIDFIIQFNNNWSSEFESKHNIKIQYYIKMTPKNFLENVLPAFENHITDIPSRSLLWQTPLLKETMANFEKLKAYAKEKGWDE